jgi:hypothetical protein
MYSGSSVCPGVNAIDGFQVDEVDVINEAIEVTGILIQAS